MTLDWIWSFGLINLRLSDYQLWQLTLKEFGLLVDRYLESEERNDRRAGRICALLANINRDPKKRQKPYNEDDFIPRGQERKIQTAEEQKAILAGIGV